jgi:methylisocitrate lyase
MTTQPGTTQDSAARLFHALHVRGQPLVLFNAWDAGSARAVADAGAQAIATGSWSVAAAHGFADGENLPREFAMENLRRIIKAVALPVTVDLESGYGQTPDAVHLRGVSDVTSEQGPFGQALEGRGQHHAFGVPTSLE